VASYLDVDAFRNRTIMPQELIDRLEEVRPGWLAAQLESSSRWADMYLAKRYSVPFSAPYPEAVKSWVARMVTKGAYGAHGFPASEEQLALITSDSEKAEEEIKQAADGQLGLIDLAPSDQSAAKVMYGGTRVYSETSPYVSKDVQRTAARREDSNRRGT
jgi:Bacteriophage Mu, Gp36